MTEGLRPQAPVVPPRSYNQTQLLNYTLIATPTLYEDSWINELPERILQVP